MAKKPRSQRRKKGSGLGGDDENTQGIGQGSTIDTEMLSDDHTIAGDDSLTTSSFPSVGHDSNESDGDNNPVDMDDLLSGKVGGNHADCAEAAAESRWQKLQDSLTAAMDEFATEKRSAKREGRLKRAFKALSQYAAGPAASEWVASQQKDALRTACLYSLRQGTPSEQYAACRVLEVLAIVLGGADVDDDAWVESVAVFLQRAVQTTQRATPVRVAALRAWAMTVFICADNAATSDSPTADNLMDFCEQVAQPEFRNETTPMALRATAFDAWSLLATTIQDVYLAGQDDVQMGRGLAILQLLSDCLDSSSIDLRSAAGECICLIHEARLNLGHTAKESENVTQKLYRRGSWEGSTWEELMDQVKQRIAELSVESTRSLSKKARKEQRATFREFTSTLVDDESPKEVVSFRNGAQLVLTTWRQIIQLNFCRHALQSGFQIQLMTNETLQTIFGADKRLLSALHSGGGGGGGNSGLSQLEKRLYMSKGSEAAKEAHMDMVKRRTKRENVKNHFITADGEDI